MSTYDPAAVDLALTTILTALDHISLTCREAILHHMPAREYDHLVRGLGEIRLAYEALDEQFPQNRDECPPHGIVRPTTISSVFDANIRADIDRALALATAVPVADEVIEF